MYAALIGMMDHLGRAALTDGHVQRVQDQFRAEMRRHGPSDDSTTPGVQHDGEEEEPGPRGDVGDVRDPQAIGFVRGEEALDEIRRRPGRRVPPGRGHERAPAHAGQARRLHEARDPFAADVETLGGELGMNTRGPIGPAGPLMDGPDLLQELTVGLGRADRGRDCHA